MSLNESESEGTSRQALRRDRAAPNHATAWRVAIAVSAITFLLAVSLLGLLALEYSRAAHYNAFAAKPFEVATNGWLVGTGSPLEPSHSLLVVAPSGPLDLREYPAFAEYYGSVLQSRPLPDGSRSTVLTGPPARIKGIEV